MRALLLVVALVLGFSSVVQAEPLDRRQVAANAKWFAHIDVDAAKAAKVAQRIYDDWLSNEEAKRALQAVRVAIGINLLEDLQSVTFFGTRFVPESGVVIVRAKVDRELLLRHLEREPSHRTNSYGEHRLHTWMQRDPANVGKTVTGCFHGPTTVVLGHDVEEVKATLDLLDKKSPTLAESGSPLDFRVPPGTVLAAGAVGLADLADADVPFLSPVVRQSELLSIALGEYEGEVFGQAKLVTKSAETARRIRDVIEGFGAAAGLQHAGNKPAMRLLEAFQISVSEGTVTADWRMPGNEVLDVIEAELARRRQPKQAD